MSPSEPSDEATRTVLAENRADRSLDKPRSIKTGSPALTFDMGLRGRISIHSSRQRPDY